MPLTEESAWALIPGATRPKEEKMEVKQVRVLRPFYLKRDKIANKGDVITVSKQEAAGFVSTNKAEYYLGSPEKPAGSLESPKTEEEKNNARKSTRSS